MGYVQRHLGLVPEFEFQCLFKRMGSYMNGSLRGLVTTVQSGPTRKKKGKERHDDRPQDRNT
jgi:hypothetical protein